MKPETFVCTLSSLIDGVEKLEFEKSVPYDSALYAFLSLAVTSLYSAKRHCDELTNNRK